MNNLFSHLDHRIVDEAYNLVKKFTSQGYELVAIHAYLTTEDIPIFWRLRLKHPSERKIILPMSCDENGIYVLKEPRFPGLKKPLYRQNDVVGDSAQSLYCVEGEACVDKLVAMGFLATTSGGSNSASNADWSLLVKRNVIIWRDADDIGLQYAEQVTQILLDLGCAIKWIDIGKLNLPEGGDCVDWLLAHPNASKEDIQKLSLIDPPNTDQSDLANRVSPDYPRFEVRENGVFYCKDVKESIFLCSWLVIKALTRDSDGVNWGRVLEFKDADNVLRRWTMPMELLGGNGDELAKELLRLGLRISPGNSIRKLLVEYITNSETSDRARCVLRTGWFEQCFILPHQLFGKTNEIVLLQSDSQVRTDYGSLGTLLDWQNNIGSLCVNNSRLIFAISLAFAAPLLKIMRAESGGFHFRGESSTGKTTALSVAASVWGGRRYIQNWRATDNGLEGLAAQHNDTLLILDELSQIDPRYAGEVAYMLSNGMGKARASRSGNVKQRLSWQLLFLSSGEVSLASHMLEAGKKVRAGQEVRMVDIPVDAGCDMGIFEILHGYTQGSVFSDTLKVACDQYHGVAGEAFLEKLVLYHHLELHTKIQNMQMEFLSKLPTDTHGQVKRVAQRFALVAAAGELATEFNITGWQQTTAITGVRKCFESWLNARESGFGSHEQDTILEQVRHFFQENVSRFDIFDHVPNYINRLIPLRCAGYRAQNGDFYVYPKTFREEICKGLGSPKDVVKNIEQCGWLLPDLQCEKPYSSIWVPTQSKTIRLYHFSSKVIGESYNAELDVS